MKDKYLMLFYLIVLVAFLLWGLVGFFDLVINFNPSKAKPLDWLFIIGVSSILIPGFFLILFTTPIAKRIFGKEKADRIWYFVSYPFLFVFIAVAVLAFIFEGLRQL